MSDLHIVAQDILKAVISNSDQNIMEILEKYLESYTSAERLFITEAFSEMLRDELMGTH